MLRHGGEQRAGHQSDLHMIAQYVSDGDVTLVDALDAKLASDAARSSHSTPFGRRDSGMASASIQKQTR